MVQVQELIHHIEQTAPLFLSASWDNSGIQAAAHSQEVNKLAVFLDPLPDCVDRALAWGADFLLSHHPLAITPRLPDRTDFLHSVLRAVLCNDVWLYAAHTSLDVNSTGPVGWLARELSLSDVRPLDPLPQHSDCGFGIIGEMQTPSAWGDFVSTLVEILSVANWRMGGTEPEEVKTVAYCPGSGAALLDRAVSAGADVLITGDLKFHQAQECAEKRTRILDVGHFILEERMMQIWAGELETELPGLEVRFFPGFDPIRIYCR
ncbi:MAG: Nif3-like dinuclear metal center hexameric protein [Desulfovibrionales bacterium]